MSSLEDPFSKELDQDGLPILTPEAAQLWFRSALNDLPRPEVLAGALVHIRRAAELEKLNLQAADLPTGMTAVSQSITAILGLLGSIPTIQARKDIAPLMRLLAHIEDLRTGRVGPMFKPRVRKRGRSSPVNDALIQGYAARTMDLLIQGGEKAETAAKLVAAALRKGRSDLRGLSRQKVTNWRYRLMQGPGAGAPAVALQIFNQPLPAGFDGPPSEVARRLLKQLESRGDAIG